MPITLYIFFGDRPLFITASDFGNDLLDSMVHPRFFSVLKYNLKRIKSINKKNRSIPDLRDPSHTARMLFYTLDKGINRCDI